MDNDIPRRRWSDAQPDSHGDYRALSEVMIVDRTGKLADRIESSFGGRGLASVARELHAATIDTVDRAAWILKPRMGLRVGVVIVVILMIGLIWLTARTLGNVTTGDMTLTDIAEISDAAFNELLIIGGALLFLFRAERRMKRRRTLDALHELRSLAHVIDMHQLSKDPTPTLHTDAHSPQLEREQLAIYLEYCSEMLAMIGKAAALYVQEFDDEVAVSVVNEIEQLTTGLSQKIWQKLVILDASAGRALAAPAQLHTPG